VTRQLTPDFGSNCDGIVEEGIEGVRDEVAVSALEDATKLMQETVGNVRRAQAIVEEAEGSAIADGKEL